MEFRQLQSFAAVVKWGSFTKAAEKLYLSQPTVSAHIQTLEEELNQPLLMRTTKTLELTPKGRQVYECASHILELRDRMFHLCADGESNIIHLGASTIPSAYILPEILPEFGQIHPETYFVIHQDNSRGVIEGLQDGVFDLGLIGMKEEKNLICIPLCEDPMVLITPVQKRFLAMQQQPLLPLRRLLEEPVILREKASGSRKNAERFLEEMGIGEEELNITARINDQETIKNLVAGGLGISMISERAAKNFVEEKRLLAFPLPGNSVRTLYLAYRRDCVLTPYVQEFAEFIRKKYHLSDKE